ncbi:myelin protein zero-like protein 2 isoform X2 [Lepisosteus oculatus]|uniref:myelin protein zero-like protein 2 isoform X2 n=1 Tax=Lepisosteus oculatus TaxID=7918 RepID=UPI003723B510
MSGVRARLLAFLAGIAVSGVLRVSAMEVYTPEEVESVNGTDAKLKCTFQSSSPLKESSASVSWHFRPLGGGAEESVFFYQDGQYPPSEGRFRGRAVWAGNLNRYDGSIMVRDVQFRDNGTFVCQPPTPRSPSWRRPSGAPLGCCCSSSSSPSSSSSGGTGAGSGGRRRRGKRKESCDGVRLIPDPLAILESR